MELDTSIWTEKYRPKVFEEVVGQDEIIKKVKEVKNSSEHAIFEAVNLLPHLVHKDFDFPGFFLVEENIETLLKRLNSNPKWGETPEKQKLEAHAANLGVASFKIIDAKKAYFDKILKYLIFGNFVIISQIESYTVI